MKGITHNHLAIIISPRQLLGACIQKNPSNSAFTLNALHEKKIENLELERLTIFNPEIIGTTITSWLQQTPSTAVSFALFGPSLQEHIFSTHTPDPSLDQFPLPHNPSWHWEKSYLFSRDHQHYFYLCGIKKYLLFQYQLLAIRMKIPLAIITSESIALLHCFRSLFGSIYRPNHLAEAMALHHDRIEQLFFYEDFRRAIHSSNSIEIQEEQRLPLLAACGLATMQGL